MDNDEQTSHEDNENDQPERPRRPRDPPPRLSQAWAIVAPHLVAPRRNAE